MKVISDELCFNDYLKLQKLIATRIEQNKGYGSMKSESVADDIIDIIDNFMDGENDE